MSKPNTNIQVESAIVFKSRQIKYIELSLPADPTKLKIQVRCAEEYMPGAKAQIETQMKGCLLENTNRLKPNQVTVVEVTMEDYETEEMKFDRMLRGSNLMGKQKIKLEISRELGDMLVFEPIMFGEYVFGALNKMIKVSVSNHQKWSDLEVTADISADQVEKVKMDIVRMCQAVYVLNHVFSSEILLDHFISTLLLQGKYYRHPDKNNLKVYIYTKQKQLARKLLQHISSLTVATIDLQLIFQSRQIRQMFYLNEFQPLEKKASDLKIKKDLNDYLQVVGELHRTIQFETELHYLYSSFKIKKFQWERNPMTIRFLQLRKKELQEKNIQINQQNRERRVMLFYEQKARNDRDSCITIAMISRNSVELEIEFRKLLLDLTSIKQQLIKVDRELNNHLNQYTDSGHQIEKQRIQRSFNVHLDIQKNYLLIIGTEENIKKVKDKISNIKLDGYDSNIELEKKLKPQRNEVNETIKVHLTKNQYNLIKNQPFFKWLHFDENVDQCSCIYEIHLTASNIDQALRIKMQLLSFFLRTKEEPWLKMPSTWTSKPPFQQKVIKIVHLSVPEKDYITDKLCLKSNHYITEAYRIEDRDRYCEFIRMNPSHQTMVYNSIFPLHVLKQYVQNGQLIKLTKLLPGNKLVWRFFKSFQPKDTCQTVLIALVAQQYTIKDSVICDSDTQFYPQYILNFNNQFPPADLYRI